MTAKLRSSTALTPRQAARMVVRAHDPHDPDAALRVLYAHAATVQERRAVVAFLPSMVRAHITTPRQGA